MPQRNPTTIPPITPSAAVTLGLTPGQSLWLCLPPGSALHTTQGEVSLRFAPRDCELAVHTLPQMRLGAGEHLPEGWNTKTAWVQVGNALHCRSEIQVIEGTPRPGLWHQVRHLLRSGFSGRDKTAKNRAFGKVPAMR